MPKDESNPPVSRRKALIVKPIKEPSGAEHPPPLSDVLPTHEFSMLIIAPRGSGKTTLILNMLSEFYKGYFHSIKVFSPTMNGDSKWTTIKKMKGILSENKHKKELEKKSGSSKGKQVDSDSESEDDGKDENKPMSGHPYSYTTAWHSLFASTKPPPVAVGDKDEVTQAATSLHRAQKKGSKKFTGKIPHKDFYSDYNEDDLQKIMTESMEEIKKFKKVGKTKHHADRQLIIFDDLVGSNLFSGKKNNPFRRLNTTLRHYSTSVIMVSQAYKEIPKTVRVNASVVILFDIANQSELQSLYEENNAGLPQDKWLSIYRYCTAEPFNFMMINYKLPKPERIWKNLSEQIPINPTQPDNREKLQREAAAEEGDDGGQQHEGKESR